MRATALDRATAIEEKKAKKERRSINPDNIDRLAQRLLARMPYKTSACRFHSFIVYFSNIQRLGWVEATGKEEFSEFQDHYAPGQPRKYFRLTKAGKKATDSEWADPLRTLYGREPLKRASS